MRFCTKSICNTLNVKSQPVAMQVAAWQVIKQNLLFIIIDKISGL